jgi:hypothetical protein
VIKLIGVSIASVAITIGTMVGFNTKQVDHREQCKQEALDVYDSLLDTSTYEEAKAVSYGLTTDGDLRLRDVLPECKVLTVEQANDLSKELEKHSVRGPGGESE